MLVSVIIPSFRQPQFLTRAIESCLEQDHADLEVIVVEDNSRDASLAIAAAFARRDDRVRVVPCPENGGLGRARNIGVAHSSGEYLCFLDSDDYLLERSISARLDAFPAVILEHGPGVVGVYGDWQHVAETIDHPIVRQPRAVMPVVQQSTYTGENLFICSAPLVRRGAVVAAGGFPEGLRMLEDFALWARIIASGGVFVPVHHMVSTYRQRPNSMLRGDGLILMSDHVQIINDWMAEAGTALADGGALTAWLEDRDPRSYGRMSWSVPSLLGSFGGTPGAASVSAATGAAPIDKRPALSDFMAQPVLSGTENPPPVRTVESSATVDVFVHVDSLARSLEAVSLIDVGRRTGINVAAMVPDLDAWEDWWPLVLLDADVIGSDDPRVDTAARVDLASPTGSDQTAAQRIRTGADVLWPEEERGIRAGSVVYVPPELEGYPALDAWLSTALHVLADRGAEPQVVADPRIRSQLGGYRSTLTSIDVLRTAAMIVAPTCADLELLTALAPTAVFDPSAPHGDHARTRHDLEKLLDGTTFDVSPAQTATTEDLELILSAVLGD